MSFGSRQTFMTDVGPVAVVAAFCASAGERRSAYPGLEARRILSRLCNDARSDDRHEVVELYELASGESLARARDIATARLIPVVLTAAKEGRLLVVPGWPWSGRSVTAGSNEESQPQNREDRVALRVMRARAEIPVQGQAYRVVPALLWRGHRDSGSWELVQQEVARAVLEQLHKASSGAEAQVVVEAMAMLADTRAVLSQGGLFVVRRIQQRSFSSVAKHEPVLTPSQLFKKEVPDDWVEFLLTDEEGNAFQTPMEVVLSDGRKATVTPDGSGLVRFSALKPGQCQLTIARLKPAPTA